MGLHRILAILLISLANISILAHAVVPHHHHDNIICFHSQPDGCHASSSEHGDACCHEGENHQTHSSSCDLTQFIERTGNAADDNVSLAQHYNNLFTCLFTFNCNWHDFSALNEIITAKLLRYIKHKDTYVSPVVSSEIGLRAPPACTLI